MNKSYYVYIISCTNHNLFYTGITNNLIRRIYEHKHKLAGGYSAKYSLNKLMYYEECHDPNSAIAREKQVKKYSQKKKIDLIVSINPGMNDLYDEVINW